MRMLWLLIVATLMVASIGYAQFKLQQHTASLSAGLITRAILIVTGGALGYIYALQYPDDRTAAILAFLVGLGMVHIPAAIILFVKQQRRSGKS